MNLGQIRERVMNELQHAPTTTGWKNDLAQVINDAYQTLMSSNRWTFRTVETNLRLLADRGSRTISFSSAAKTATIATSPTYEDYDGLVLRSSDPTDSMRRYGRIAGQFPLMWRQCFDRADGYNLGGFPDPDVTVAAFPVVYLDEPPAAAWDGAPTDCIIRHDRYQLPYDCAEIIGIVSRDDKWGEIALVNRTRERTLMLNTNQDSAQHPVAWLMDDPVSAGPAPRKTLVATGSGAGGTLPAGTYRYFYAFWGKGCYSAPSNIVTVTLTGATSKVDLTAMEVEPGNRYWRVKHVFCDTGDGVFNMVGAPVSHTASTMTHDTPTTPDELPRWDDRMATPHKCVRFWPRPASDQWASVSYLRMPSRLAANTDTPEMPEEYHRILVHLAVVQFAARFKQPDLVKLHSAQAKELTALMEHREITRYNTQQRDAWSPRRGRRWFPTTPGTMNNP